MRSILSQKSRPLQEAVLFRELCSEQETALLGPSCLSILTPSLRGTEVTKQSFRRRLLRLRSQ